MDNKKEPKKEKRFGIFFLLELLYLLLGLGETALLLRFPEYFFDFPGSPLNFAISLIPAICVISSFI